MTAIIVKKNDFSGAGKVYDAGPQGLAAIIRGLAIDNARTLINAASIASVTDNSTGTAATMLTVAGIIAPSGVYNAVSAGGAQTAALNTALVALRSAQASMASTINKVATKLGLPAVSWDEGTNTYNVIPAMTLVGTTANGSTAVNYSSFVNAASIAIANLHCLFLAMNKVLVALGLRPIPGTFLQSYVSAQTIDLAGNNLNMVVIPAVVSDTTSANPGAQVHTAYENFLSGNSFNGANTYNGLVQSTDYVAGTNSVKLADATLFLQDMANNYATLAAVWLAMQTLTGPAAITDSTGGTASVTEPGPTLVPVVATPLVGYVDVAGASASASALNTLFGTYQNAFSSIQAKLNVYNNYEAYPAIPDGSGGSVSGTLSSETVTPSAGSGGVYAAATFTESTTLNFLATDTLTIGNQTFTFVSAIGTTPGNILVGADTNAGFRATMANVIASMAASISGSGATANYIPNTTPANVEGSIAAGNGLTTGQTVIFEALADGVGGNSLASTYTNSGTSAGSFGAANFAGGLAATSASLISIDAALEVIENNISTLAQQLNYVLVNLGLPMLVDDSGGVAQPGLIVIPATSTTDNVVNPTGVANAAIETIVTAIRNNMSTLNAALTTIIGDTIFVAPISVVAG